MKHYTNPPNYLTEFLGIYTNSPSLAIWRAIEAQALSHLRFDPPALDLACGTGHFARILLDDMVIIGCDLDMNSIGVAAREKILDYLSVADARFLPYPKRAFNSVLANCALEHIPDVERVIAEVARVLKPMGIFAFTVPSEHFNDFLFIPRFYKLVGLPSRARRHIHWYNALQKHFNIDPLSVWQQRLKLAGFSVISHRYYMPMAATLFFSLWDIMAKWTLNLPGRRARICVQQFLLDRIPRRLLFWILYHHLIGYYKSSLHSSSGSGLLIIARREQDLYEKVLQ